MANVSWGKCKLWLGLLGASDAAPSTWIAVPTPVEDSTQLSTTKGDKMEAKIEGGEYEDVRYKRNTYALTFEIRATKGREKPVEDTDGVIDGFYALKLQPEDPEVEGLVIDKGILSMTPSYTTADGVVWEYTLDALAPKTGDTVKFEVVTDPTLGE